MSVKDAFEDALKNREEKSKGAHLSGDSLGYSNVKCSKCAYKLQCTHFDANDDGCKFRKALYDDLFAKVEFSTFDALATNRLRLVGTYYTELMLKRHLGVQLSNDESTNLKTVLSELSSLHIDKKGDLVSDNKGKFVHPWDQDPSVIAMRNELEELRRKVSKEGKNASNNTSL